MSLSQTLKAAVWVLGRSKLDIVPGVFKIEEPFVLLEESLLTLGKVLDVDISWVFVDLDIVSWILKGKESLVFVEESFFSLGHVLDIVFSWIF